VRLIFADFVQVDKSEAKIFVTRFLYVNLLYFCVVKLKRKRALLGSNPSGINLTYTNCRTGNCLFTDNSFFYNLVTYALKNPSIRFITGALSSLR